MTAPALTFPLGGLVALIVNVVVAIVSAFGARAAYLGGVFRYPIAIPFVRSAESQAA